MKKLPVFMTALVMSLSAVMPFNAMADPEEGYLPIMYLSVEDNDKISVLPDGTVYINNQNLTGDDSIRVNIYIRDDSKSCWNIAPKIKCADANIKFNEHAVESENNAYSSPHEPEDDPEQRITSISFRYDNGESATFTPEVKEQKIVVSDRPMGDVNNDSIVDAVDASLVLSEYASLSTEQGSTFSTEEKYSANINMDEFIDAVDATAILGYYAYISTGGELDFAGYLSSIQQ